MPTKTRNILQMVGAKARVLTLLGLPNLTDVELTKSSWAKPIRSYADVPDVYKSFFDPLLTEGQDFPYAVLTPSYERFIHKTTEKLICDFGHEIDVLEKIGDEFEVYCYPLDGIIYVEFKSVLLAASLTISGVTDQGAYAVSTLKFNSVTDYLLVPILNRIRLAAMDSTEDVQSEELRKFDPLHQMSYKFMNYGRRSILGGEKVLHILLQPEIRERIFTFMGKTYSRMISPTLMSILTDRELILIREEEARSRGAQYGGIWNYIPLNKIASLSLSKKDGDLVGLTVRLPEDASFELLFQATAKEELDRLLTHFKELPTR